MEDHAVFLIFVW